MIYISLVSLHGAFFDLFGSGATCTIIWTSNTPGSIGSMTMSSDGKYIAVEKGGLYTNTTLSLFSRNSSSPVWNFTLEQNGYAFESLSISDDGSYLSVSGDRTASFSGIAIFSRSSNIPVWTLQGVGSPYKTWFDAYLSGNGRLIVIDSQVQPQLYGQVQDSVSVLRNPNVSPLWNYNTTYPIVEPLRLAEPPAVSYEGAYIAKTNDLGYQGSLYLFSQHDNRTIWTSKGNWLDLRMSENGDLVIARNSTTVSAFGNNNNQTISSITLVSAFLDVSNDGSTLAALERTGTNDVVHVYDLRTTGELFSVRQTRGSFLSLGLSSDGSTVAFLAGGRLFAYDRAGRSICTIPVPQLIASGEIAISRDGRSVAVQGSQLSYVAISPSSQAFQDVLVLLAGGMIAAAAVVGSILFIRHRRPSAK